MIILKGYIRMDTKRPLRISNQNSSHIKIQYYTY
jgi:hypothetical protein